MYISSAQSLCHFILFQRHTKPCVPSRRKLLSHVFNQGVTAYFTSTSVVNSLPFRWFLMDPKRRKTPGPKSGGPKTLKILRRNRSEAGWQNEAQWFPYLWTPLEASGWQVICNRHQREASCHLPATDTLGTWRYMPRKYTCLGAMV